MEDRETGSGDEKEMNPSIALVCIGDKVLKFAATVPLDSPVFQPPNRHSPFLSLFVISFRLWPCSAGAEGLRIAACV